ncbi:MAG TPA: PP2C family serine/threonine-protein phosphatase [Acidobacteriaceae bacterium]|nr:PP2C family serine/threonine-protein phosphatase [Acidobacteriaceae bacterium]
MLELEFAELTDTGLVREHNEDCVGHFAPSTPAQMQSQGWLFALADGVGGLDKGEVASRLAIDAVVAGFRKIPRGVMHVSLLPRLIQDANQAIFDERAKQGKKSGASGMATTLVLCALRFDSAVISHVGDSRCYLFREHRLSPLTHDHNMAAEQVKLGAISAEDAESSPARHVLTRAVGTEMFVAADTITVSILPGDVLMLCSDGLHGYVPDAAIQWLLDSTPDLKNAATALVDAANEAGGHDNVSVTLVRVKAVEQMGLYRGRPYRLL